MRKTSSLITPLLFLSYVLIISPAHGKACNAPVISPDAMVKSADVIVRAVPIDSLENEGVKFKILEVLKGNDLPATLLIKGALSKSDDYNERPVPYWHVRPSGSTSCYAYGYKENAEFLLLLNEQDGKLTPYWYPLAPTNEQLRSGNDPWLVWVRNFLALQKQKDGQQSSATSKKVCVVGNVLNQREILFDGRLTVMQAIKQAGGIRPDRRNNEVLVLSRMRQGGMRVIDIDLKAIGKKPYKDLDLQDLDIIEVLSRKPDKVHEPFVNPCPWVPVFKNRM
jgi:hypothetical protein